MCVCTCLIISQKTKSLNGETRNDPKGARGAIINSFMKNAAPNDVGKQNVSFRIVSYRNVAFAYLLFFFLLLFHPKWFAYGTD